MFLLQNIKIDAEVQYDTSILCFLEHTIWKKVSKNLK